MNAQPHPEVFSSELPSHDMLGMRLDHLPVDDFIGRFVADAMIGRSVYCCVPDVSQCVLTLDNPEHREIVNSADYVMSDSTVLQTARAIRHGVRRLPPLLGSDLMEALCSEAARQGVRIGLIGGRSDAALEALVNNLKASFPGLDIVYAYSPPFRPLTECEETAMLDDLKQAKAQLVFLGIGCPKQEQWMARYKGRISGAMIGVGAAFDTLAGIVSRSPRFVHYFGLEWLFRFVREPRRLYKRYLGAAPRFVGLLFLDWVKARGRG